MCTLVPTSNQRGTVEPYAPPPHFHTEPQPAATAWGWWLRSERQHLQDFSRSARFTHAADSFLPQNTAGKGSGFLHGDKMTVMDDVLLLGGSWWGCNHALLWFAPPTNTSYISGKERQVLENTFQNFNLKQNLRKSCPNVVSSVMFVFESNNKRPPFNSLLGEARG